jgi:nicotinamide-nucleotide amidase
MLATAESCTGGLVAGLLTSIAGSSAVVERGFVTYSNEAKAEMLGVPMALIEQHGAVSEQVAREMAEGALRHSRANVAVSVTGVAGQAAAQGKNPWGWFTSPARAPKWSPITFEWNMATWAATKSAWPPLARHSP